MNGWNFWVNAVLGHAVSEYLYRELPDLSEGQLARRKSALVSEATLSTWAGHLRLGSFLILGKGEEQTGGREKNALLADAYEAVLGRHLHGPGLGRRLCLCACVRSKDPAFPGPAKGQWIPKAGCRSTRRKFTKKPPLYRLVKTKGPDHAKEFEVEVLVDGKSLARGRGKTKKEAEQDGATLALGVLQDS